MGSGPAKGFNSEHVQEIITKKHDASQNKIAKEDSETATFAAGCFWGVQLAFQRVPGVVSSMVGYKELLAVLFDRMDPTTLNRQGNDRGTQYRSGVYYHSEEQRDLALDFIKEIQPKYKDKIV